MAEKLAQYERCTSSILWCWPQYKIKRTTKKRVVCCAHCENLQKWNFVAEGEFTKFRPETESRILKSRNFGTSCSRSLLYILPLWQVCTWLQFPLGSKSSLLLPFLWCFVGEELAFHWDWLWSSFVHFFLHQINYKKELILAELW